MKRTAKRVSAALAILLGGFSVGTAQADNEALIELLIERGVLTEDDVAEMRTQMRDEPAAEAEDESRLALQNRYQGMQYEPTEPLVGEPFNVRVRNFRIETPDGKHRFGIRGRLMVDGAYTDFQDRATVDDDRIDRGVLARYGTILRRARLGALGIMYYNWEWQLEVDFRDEEVRFANAYLAYLFDNGRLAIGNFKEPFSIESSTSSRRITFLERATPVDAYRPSRQIGLMYETLIPNMYGAIGVFGGDGVGRDRDVTEGYSVAARGSIAPYLDEASRTWTHLGLSYNYRRNAYEGRGRDKEFEDVRMRSRLGTRAVDGRFIGRRDLDNVDDFQTVALEGAFGVGPFSLQGEYLQQDLDRKDGDDVTHRGYYVQGSYLLTGENRNYRAFSGDLGRIQVNRPLSAGGPGAWKVAARYATANSFNRGVTNDGGQKMDHYTLGLNWYPEDDIVFKFNVIYLDAETGQSRSDELDRKETKGWVYAFRAQYEF